MPTKHTVYDHKDIQVWEDLLERKENTRRVKKKTSSTRRQDGHKQDDHLGENEPNDKDKKGKKHKLALTPQKPKTYKT